MKQSATNMTNTDAPSAAFRADDRDVGLSVRIDRVIERALEDRPIVGTVVLVSKGGQIVYRAE